MLSAYSATKFGLRGLTQSAGEFHLSNVAVRMSVPLYQCL